MVFYNNILVGYIAYGVHYTDELLQNAIPETLELYHMIIHEPYQGNGLGKLVTIKALQKMAQDLLGRKVLIACHPDNTKATALYTGLGFRLMGKNYDDDPLYEMDIAHIQNLQVPEILPIKLSHQSYEAWESECLSPQASFDWNKWERGLED